MTIAKDKVAIIDYTLTDDEGNTLDQSENGEFAYLHGASNIIPGLEQALEGKIGGDEAKVTVTPADGYGELDPNAIQKIPRNMFPEDMELTPGMQFQAQSPEGAMMVLTVAEIVGDTVVADANHALAGKTLHFDVKVISVRDASAEELEHGHVHGAGGQNH
jgi:FKBP-type peptidyl-prolyl cis-trans isomerase SlyD